jgi:hypothetical protein
MLGTLTVIKAGNVPLADLPLEGEMPGTAEGV